MVSKSEKLFSFKDYVDNFSAQSIKYFENAKNLLMQDYCVYRLNCIFCITGLADFVPDKMSRRVNNVVEAECTAFLEFIVDSHYCMGVMTV
jgi:hypothetical protein